MIQTAIYSGKKLYKDELSNQFNHIQQTLDGGYVASSNRWLIKLDSNGNIQWQKNLKCGNCGDWADIYFSSIHQTSDGGYIAASSVTYGYNGSSLNVYPCIFLKLDANGNIQWQKSYVGNDTSELYQLHFILQTSDGGYILPLEENIFRDGATHTWLHGF